MLHNQDLAKIFNGLALRGKIKLVQTSQVTSWPVISLLLYNYTDYLTKGVYLARNDLIRRFRWTRFLSRKTQANSNKILRT